MLGGLPVADLVIAAVLGVSALFGLMRGFVKEVMALVIWASAGLLSLAFGEPAGEAIGLNLSPRLLSALGFGLVFVGVLVTGAFVQRFLRALVQTTELSGTDRMLGLLFGAARGLVLVTLALIVIQPFAEQQPWWSESRTIAPLLEQLGPAALELQEAVMERFPGDASPQTDPAPATSETPADVVLPVLREALEAS